jgi:hypothetical protein
MQRPGRAEACYAYFSSIDFIDFISSAKLHSIEEKNQIKFFLNRVLEVDLSYSSRL